MNTQLILIFTLSFLGFCYLILWWLKQEKMEPLIAVSGLSSSECHKKIDTFFENIMLDNVLSMAILNEVDEAFEKVGEPQWRAQQTQSVKKGRQCFLCLHGLYMIYARITCYFNNEFGTSYLYEVEIFECSVNAKQQTKTLSLG